MQGQLTEALTVKERLEIELTEAVGKLRILEGGKAAADAATALQGEQMTTIQTQTQQLATAAEAAEVAAREQAELKQQVADLKAQVQTLENKGGSASSEI